VNAIDPTERAGLAGRDRFVLAAAIFTAFSASFAVMAIEIVAGRVLARNLGSSLYTWTSVIGVVLSGITIGNYIGGRLADWFRPQATLGALLFLCAGACFLAPYVNEWASSASLWGGKAKDISWPLRVLHNISGGAAPEADDTKLLLPWAGRTFGHAFLVYALPSTFLGMVGPVVAKMALALGGHVGRTVGSVYAAGALGSIAGTLVSGYYLISKLGTEPVVLILGLALCALGLLYAVSPLWRAPAGRVAVLIGIPLSLGIPALLAATVGVHTSLQILSSSSRFGAMGLILVALAFLAVLGVVYSLTAARGSRSAPEILSFLLVLWVGLLPAGAATLLFQSWGALGKEGKPRWEWIERGGRWVLRERADSDDGILYIDESNYSYIKVDRETETVETDDGGEEEREKKRNLVLDNLTHAYYVRDQPEKLEYEYEDIYKAFTHKFKPAEADQDRGLKGLFIGGGGYVFPRYLRAIWPECYIEIAEIDPAVTAAVLAEFGLPAEEVQIVKSPADRERAGNPLWIHHLDARNHIEDLVRRKDAGQPVPEFDYIYGDAFNDYAVPFHLTTKELNDKVKRLLKPESGLYLINIIDIFNFKESEPRTGLFLGAVYNTFRRTFGEHVYVYSCNEGEPSTNRDTYIVVGALRPLDVEDLPGPAEPFQFEGSRLTEEHLRILTDSHHAGSTVITDDYAPVENFLKYVVNERKWD